MKTDTILIQKFSLSKETIKPKLFALAYYSIAFILLVSGFSKILSPENFLNTLNTTLNFLGESIIILIAAALPVIEIAVSLMLALKIKIKETLAAAVILFSSFLLFSIYGTIAEFDVDCGCFGTVIKNDFGIGMIIRNIILLLLTILIFHIILKKRNGVDKTPV